MLLLRKQCNGRDTSKVYVLNGWWVVSGEVDKKEQASGATSRNDERWMFSTKPQGSLWFQWPFRRVSHWAEAARPHICLTTVCLGCWVECGIATWCCFLSAGGGAGLRTRLIHGENSNHPVSVLCVCVLNDASVII